IESGETGEELAALIATREDEDPYHLAVRAEMRDILADEIGLLDDKERKVLGLYYLEELTMKEVGVVLDIGESRVSQIHTAALLRLRSRLQTRLGLQPRSRKSNTPQPAESRGGR